MLTKKKEKQFLYKQHDCPSPCWHEDEGHRDMIVNICFWILQYFPYVFPHYAYLYCPYSYLCLRKFQHKLIYYYVEVQKGRGVFLEPHFINLFTCHN